VSDSEEGKARGKNQAGQASTRACCGKRRRKRAERCRSRANFNEPSRVVKSEESGQWRKAPTEAANGAQRIFGGGKSGVRRATIREKRASGIKQKSQSRASRRLYARKAAPRTYGGTEEKVKKCQRDERKGKNSKKRGTGGGARQMSKRKRRHKGTFPTSRGGKARENDGGLKKGGPRGRKRPKQRAPDATPEEPAYTDESHEVGKNGGKQTNTTQGPRRSATIPEVRNRKKGNRARS